MTRISGGGLGRNPFGHVEAKTTRQTESAGQQIERELFGKKPPKVVDDDSRQAEERLALLSAWVKRLARFAAEGEGDVDAYSVRLAKDTIAMIDQHGVIYVGVEFLDAHEADLALVVGVLAHEVGHRPKRWANYRRDQGALSKDDLLRMCRLEETRADYFAGRALATFGLSADPICRFLLALEAPLPPGKKPPAGGHEYFPAPVRVDVVKEGFADGARLDSQMKSMFPELRKRAGKLDIGSG